MIKMVKAKDLKLGMKLSNDNLEIRSLSYIGGFADENRYDIHVEGIAGMEWKGRIFNRNDELPIYYDDSNGGED